MSRRRGAPLVVALALVAGAAAEGQEPAAVRSADREARLQARLDSIRSAMDTLTPYDPGQLPGAPEPVPLDTSWIGGVRVITPIEDSVTVAAWMETAVARTEARMGRIPVTSDPPTVRVDWRPITVRRELPDAWTRILGLFPGQVRGTLENALSRSLTPRLPGPVREWLSGPLGPAASAYRELATSPTWVARECFRGNGRGCAVALGLEPLDLSSLTPDQAAQLEAAVSGHPPAQRFGDQRFAFLSPDARRSFLHYLLRSRPGALEKLWAMEGSRGQVKDLLESTAGEPLEPILTRWSAEVVATRPTPVLGAAAAGTTVVWILLFLGLAARSTRWRAG